MTNNKGSTSTVFYIWVTLLLALIILGTFAIALSFVEGQDILEISKHIQWTMLVSVYIFFVVSGSGMCVITSLGSVFGIKRYELINRRGVFFASIAIMVGLLAIALHLGRLERLFVYLYISPNLRSAIFWMGFFYTFYLLFVIIEYLFLARADILNLLKSSQGLKKLFYHLLILGRKDESEYALSFDNKIARVAAVASLVTGLAAVSTLGAIFGHSEARSLWYGAYYPVYFVLSATFSGLSFFLFILILTYWINGKKINGELNKLIGELGKLLALMLSIGLLFTTWMVFSSVLNPEKIDSIMLLLKGPFSFSFYVFEILLGGIIPIILLLLPKTTHQRIFLSSLLILIGLFVERYNFLTIGQVLIPLLSDYPASFFPSFYEAVIVMGITALFALLYTFGVKFLPLGETNH